MTEDLKKIEKILVIGLSNIGDIILTTPVIETLKNISPKIRLDILVGPKGKEVLGKDNKIRNLIIYNKKSSLKEKISLVRNLRSEKYDLVIDLRHTLIPLLLKPKNLSFIFRISPKKKIHMCERHLRIIEKMGLPKGSLINTPIVYFDKQDEEYIENLLRKEIGTDEEDILVVISPGARSSTKCWRKENFIEMAKILQNELLRAKIILVGSKDDFNLAEDIRKEIKKDIYNFAGKTTIPQLVFLLKKAKVLITNDSAVLHCGSVANIPTISIFGPTDPLKYGPLAKNSVVLRRLLPCVPCEKAQCRYGHRKCLELVRPWEVVEAGKRLIFANYELRITKRNYKRILVIRTDRIGDVVLSTPVIKNLRYNFPQSFIAMMVSPYTKDAVEGNPYLDEVVVYDKEKKQRTILANLKFIFNLRKYKFDLAIILHPTNRVHSISFLAGIKRRVGYHKKMGFLNTDKIKEKKYLGEKHELDYNLDLIGYLGIPIYDKSLFFPISRETEEAVSVFLEKNGLEEKNFIVIHPGASCPSKLWPVENFASVADRLIGEFGFKILIVTDEKNSHLGERVKRLMEFSSILGRFSLKELGAILKKAKLFISNDSGPVHIAVAVNTPVISIFGRKQPGLSPKRWRPLGEKDMVLHKDVGCLNCLAHDCKIGFKCIKSISPQEVLEAVRKILDKENSNLRIKM